MPNMQEIFFNGFFEAFILFIKTFYPIFLIYFFFMGGIIVVKRVKKKRYMEKLKSSGIMDIDKMAGSVFEDYLQSVFMNNGYKVLQTKRTRDFGADLILEKDNIKTIVQAKRYKSKVGIKAIQEAAASIKHYDCHNAIVVTNSYFTKPAKDLAASNKVELWNRDILIDKLVVNKDQKKIILPDEKKCFYCSSVVSKKVEEFCINNAGKLDNKIVCYNCQKHSF